MWSFQCFIFLQIEYKYDKGDFWGSHGELKIALLRQKSMTTVAQEASIWIDFLDFPSRQGKDSGLPTSTPAGSSHEKIIRQLSLAGFRTLRSKVL